jgi:hypothetical protein
MITALRARQLRVMERDLRAADKKIRPRGREDAAGEGGGKTAASLTY